MPPSAELSGPGVAMVAFAAGFLPTGLLLLRHAPRHPVSRPVLLAGACAVAWLLVSGVAAQGVEASRPAVWAAQWLLVPPWAFLTVALVRFPHGCFTLGRGRLERAAAAAGLVATLAVAVAAAPAPHTILTDPMGPARPTSHLLVLLAAGSAFALLVVAAVTSIMLIRSARQVDPGDRWAYASLVPAGALLATGAVLDGGSALVGSGNPIGGYLSTAAIVALPVGMVVAVFEGRWADLDVVSNRRLLVLGVWLTGAVLCAALLSLVLPATGGSGSAVPVLIATAVVLALAAAHRRVVHAAERWVYGLRDEPLDVVRDVGRLLGAAGNPVEALRRAPGVLADALRLPYARLEVDIGGQATLQAEHGRRLVEPSTIPLTHGDRVLGTLEVSPRRRGEGLTPTERDIVEAFASHAAAVAHSHRLALEVQYAREHLVRAREDERLRLRRDLHDGLGPVIAGARMQLAAAVTADATTARSLAAAVAADLEGASESVREIVQALRPSSLDEGLDTAIEQTAHRLLPGHVVALDLDVPERLPAATEVALLRIATEALTNVALHAGATRCTMSLAATETEVVLEVCDDGRPHRSDRTVRRSTGLGQASMRVRAEELGGAFDFVRSAEGATVRVRIPRAGEQP